MQNHEVSRIPWSHIAPSPSLQQSPLSYLAILAAGAAHAGWRWRDATALLMPPVLAAMHLAWAAGFWCAILARRR